MTVESPDRKPEKFIPHPILDDPVKMMRIIANPVYDKLTISRAAHIRRHKSARLNGSKEMTMNTPLRSINNEQMITSPPPTNNDQPQLKFTSRNQNPPPFRLPTRSSTNRMSPRNIRLPSRSRTHSFQSSIIENDKKPIADGTIRYVNSRHGFEVQRYSSSNWLSIDLLSKEVCESHDKTFLEMLDKKEQEELVSRSIYTSEYYRNRWDDLLHSYKQGTLTHNQWAKQNYQLNCLKTFYTQAFDREQYRISLHAQNQRKRRAHSAYNEWKEGKHEDNPERPPSYLNTPNHQHTKDRTSVLSNVTNRMSVSSSVNNEPEELPLFRPNNSSKHTKLRSDTFYMLDKQRWSLDAMLKRVVGLAEPLPPPPKITKYQNPSFTNLSIDTDSGIESGA